MLSSNLKRFKRKTTEVKEKDSHGQYHSGPKSTSVSSNCYPSSMSGAAGNSTTNGAGAGAGLIDPGHEDTKTLELLLKNSQLKSIFKEFLESEYSEENLEFWETIEGLKANPAPSPSLQAASKEIVETFIATGSDREVNIDAPTRNLLVQEVQAGCVTIASLCNAQTKIYNLMARDSYTRFLKSDYFAK